MPTPKQSQPPDTLPANFTGWDAEPPDTLPADFNGWDQPKAAAAPTATIKNAPTGVRPWLDSAENDIRYGGGATILGRMLRGLGAPGINRGVSEGVADQVAGPLIGPVKAAQGIGEMGTHPVSGALHAILGGLQTVNPALAFAAPEAGEAAAKLPGVLGRISGNAAAKVLPSVGKARAGEAFKDVMSAAHNVAIDVSKPGNAALETWRLAESGGQKPKVVTDFLKRVADPNKPPLTYKEARDFYSNASRVSFDEMNRLTPVMKRQLGEFTRQLGDSIQEATGKVGKLKEFQSAMKQYANAMKQQDRLDVAKDVLKTAAKVTIPGAAAGYAFKEIVQGKK